MKPRELHALGLLALSVCARAFVMAGVFNESILHNLDSLDSPVIAFLRTELETCGFVSWCTINVTTVDTTRTLGMCCQGCTCDPRCEQTDSCCPDYEFGNLTNWRTYTTVPDFADALQNWTASGIANDEESTNFRSVRPVIVNRGKCFRAQAARTSRYRENSGDFNMISECPAIDGVSIEMKTRCELDYHKDIDRGEPDKNLSFVDLIPVTSLVDGEIYKNSHCLTCSLSSSRDSTTWTVSLLCHSQQMQPPYYEHFANPNKLLEAIVYNNIIRIDSCNIIFDPRGAAVSNQRCSKFDFDICPHNDANESDLCTRYVSPVYLYAGSSKTQVVYKNSACLACQWNAQTDSNNRCYTFQDIRRLKIGLNVPMEMAGVGVTEHVNDLLYVLFPGDTEHGCKAGEVFDRRAGMCRKVYCPKGMFAFRGECRIFFRQVESGVFTLMLRLDPTSVIHSHAVVAAAIYNTTSLMAEKNSVIAVKRNVVWCSEAGRFLLTLEFTVDHLKGTFSDAIDFTESLLKTPWSFKGDEFATAFKVMLAESTQVAFRKYIDVRNGETFLPLHPLNLGSNKRNYSILKITEENFCYRVLLEQDEYSLAKHQGTILIKSNGKLVFHNTPTFTDEKLGQLLVCIKHIVDHLPNVMKDNIHENEVNRMHKDKPSKTEETIKTSIAPLLLALTAVLVVGTCVTRNRLAHMALQRNRATEQANSVEPTLNQS